MSSVLKCLQGSSSKVSCLVSQSPWWVWPVAIGVGVAGFYYLKFKRLHARFQKECDGAKLYYRKDDQPIEYPEYRIVRDKLIMGKVIGVKIKIPAGKMLTHIADHCEGFSRVFRMKLGAPVDQGEWAYLPRASWAEDDSKKN